MRDEDFEYFIGKFGEAGQSVPVPASSIEKWSGRLPAKLLEYWANEGWCGYAQGLLWTVDPDDYEDLVDEWLADSPLEEIDEFHVIARSAFGGSLAVRGEVREQCDDLVFAERGDGSSEQIGAKDGRAQRRFDPGFFSGSELAEFDKKDEARRPLFARAVKKLGPLAADEMYGFEPALVAGGRMKLENLRRVKLDQHLTILRQLSAPFISFPNIDIDKLIGE